MKTTGLFTTRYLEIKIPKGQSVKLIPFGDIHRDSDMHADSHWQEFLKYARAQGPNTLFLGMGDYTDGVSTTERIILGDQDIHDTTKKTMDGVYKGVTKTLAKELSFMRGRLIGLLGGNHYWSFQDGQNTDTALAAALGAPFLGVCSFIRLSLRLSRSRCITVDILAHHGRGGGQLAGSTFNTVEKMSLVAQADIYLMGHDHNKGCIPGKPRLVLHANTSVGAGTDLAVRERTPWYGRTGSFLKAYEHGKVSYNVDAGRTACALGWIEFDILPRRACRNKEDYMELVIRGTA